MNDACHIKIEKVRGMCAKAFYFLIPPQNLSNLCPYTLNPDLSRL